MRIEATIGHLANELIAENKPYYYEALTSLIPLDILRTSLREGDLASAELRLKKGILTAKQDEFAAALGLPKDWRNEKKYLDQWLRELNTNPGHFRGITEELKKEVAFITRLIMKISPYIKKRSTNTS